MKTTDFIERQERTYQGVKHSLKRHTKICKRNGDKPHEFIKKKTSIFLWGGGKWTHYECRHCGKTEFTSSSKLNIVE